MTDFLTPDELAERWKLHANTLNIWRMNGTGPEYIKVGQSVRYPIEAIETYERENTKGNE